MSTLWAGGKSFAVSLVVFDKDGLMFESDPFWKELARQRLIAAEPYMDRETQGTWLELLGVEYGPGDGWAVSGVRFNGAFALASPAEEISLTAAILVEHGKMEWLEAKQSARHIFQTADQNLSLNRALVARKGFPAILERLRQAGIPYGIATSDIRERALESMALFDQPDRLAFVITPEDVALGKPEPDMLQLAARRCGLPTNEIVMVGDSLVDVVMARRAGAIGIGIPEYPEIARDMTDIAHAVLNNFDEMTFQD